MPFKEKDQFEQLCQESAKQALTKAEKIKVRGYQVRQGLQLCLLLLQLRMDINRYSRKFLKQFVLQRLILRDAKNGMVYHWLLLIENMNSFALPLVPAWYQCYQTQFHLNV